MLGTAKTIVDITREFLNSNGATQHAKRKWRTRIRKTCLRKRRRIRWKNAAVPARPQYLFAEGLVEMFDGSIGAGSVTMPLGGRYQMTPVQAMCKDTRAGYGQQIRDPDELRYGPVPDGKDSFLSAVYAILLSKQAFETAAVR